MTPQARAQAAIEILDQVIDAARDAGPAADMLVARYFKSRRYAGSKDRRAVRDLVYAAIRHAGERPPSGRAALIGLSDSDPSLIALFDGSPHAPSKIAADEARAVIGTAPAWLEERLSAAIGREELPALLERAPLDLRVNSGKASRDTLLATLGGTPTPHSPDGIRFTTPIIVETHPAFLAGQMEVQDEGSQLLARATGVMPGMTVIDLCAGAGGKTLAMAVGMVGQGRIIATDTDRGRLTNLLPRAARAGVTIVETRLLNPNREMEALADLAGVADVVLVDAPCSGTGTWRRNPEARWRLTPERLDRLVTLQRHLLDLAATLVRPGGTLTYGVCSLLPEEGPDAFTAFLGRHSDWTADTPSVGTGTAVAGGLRLTPASSRTDGFFFARARRP